MEWITGFRRKVELHRHLEGSIPFDLLWKNRMTVAPTFKNKGTFKDYISQVAPMKNLGEVLEKFGIFQAAFYKCGPSFTFECAKGVVEQAINEGIDTIDIRFSPHFMCNVDKASPNLGYPDIWDTHFENIVKGVEEATEGSGVKVGLIAIVSRNYGPNSGIMTAKFCKKWLGKIDGFDFAAGELDYPIKDFDKTVELVHEMKLPLTVHSGEGTDSRYIKETLDRYRPRRLGHAVTLADNNDLMEQCAREQICIECCPFSNYVTGCIGSLEEHPLKLYYKKGIPVSINTDDPGLFQTDMNSEWSIVKERIGLTKEEILEINETSRKFAFCNK